MDPAAYQIPINITGGNLGPATDGYRNVWSGCEVSMWDMKRQILEWLSPLPSRERHRAVRRGRVDGVGDWLLRTGEFEKWHTSEDQEVNPVLFCYGNPGAGKTHLSSLVIDSLCDAIGGDNMAVAHVYCDFHAYEAQTTTSTLAVLLKQLIEWVEPIPEEIREAFKRAKKVVDGRALELPEICAMLVKSLSSLRRGFIFIDALDQFPGKDRPQLWESLQYIIRKCPNARLFITGRPHIREEVQRYYPKCHDLILIRPTEEDIRGYLATRLRLDSEPDAMDLELEVDILRIIPDRISGEFLLVSIIIDAILGETTMHRRRQMLHKMTSGLGLGDAYNATLGRIREQKGGKAKLGMEALMWILHSERLLKAEELCHALGVKTGATDLDVENVPSIRTLLGCTLGLVTIDARVSTVRFIHFTLQEYLAANPNLFTTSHSLMAEICLTYLNFRSICGLSTLDAIPSTLPFLHYASCYWGFHARKEMTGGVKHLALRLLERDGNHISADILLREQSVDFLSWWDRHCGRHPNLRGFTGLHCIAYMGISEIAIAMVHMKRWDLNGRDSNGATPLIWAAKYGNYKLVKLLLEQGDVNCTLSDKKGLTPLAYATKAGQEGLVNLLLERGDTNPDPLDEDGRTPLSYAAETGYEGIVEMLLERWDVKPDLPDICGWTPLSRAAGSGHEGVVKLLLARGVNPGSQDICGLTPLSRAAGSGREGVVKLLLEQGIANPDESDIYSQTPLLWAARSGHHGVVKLLLEQGIANPDESDIYSQTPLLWAARSGHDGIVKLLLDWEGLNPDPRNTNGRTPLFFAASSGHEGIVKLFLQRQDVNPDSPDNKGRTPLSRAVMKGHEGVVKQLLGRGDVSIDSPDEDGRTPLSLAAMKGQEGVIKLLLQSEKFTPRLSRSKKQTKQASVLVSWISCGVLLLSVIAITSSRLGASVTSSDDRSGGFNPTYPPLNPPSHRK